MVRSSCLGQRGCLGQSLAIAGKHHARRHLSHCEGGRIGRVRHYLRGRGHQSRHPRRHQGILPLRLRRSRRHHERAAQVRPAQVDLRLGPLQLPAGGAHARPLRASEHRARQPRVRGQLHRLHGDALRKGEELRALAQGPRPAPYAGGARSHRRAPARCPGDDARAELPAPRHRSRQHHGTPRRHTGAARLRHGAACGRREKSRAHRHRQGRILAARAVRRRQPSAGSLVGPLRVRRDALPGRHRQGARGSDAALRRGPHGVGGAGSQGQLSA